MEKKSQNNNIELKEYYEKFDEYPYLLTTQTYDSDDYKFLMIMAVNRGTPLTKEEIGEYFNNNYDDVNESSKRFSNFGKK